MNEDDLTKKLADLTARIAADTPPPDRVPGVTGAILSWSNAGNHLAKQRQEVCEQLGHWLLCAVADGRTVEERKAFVFALIGVALEARAYFQREHGRIRDYYVGEILPRKVDSGLPEELERRVRDSALVANELAFYDTLRHKLADFEIAVVLGDKDIPE